MPISSVDRPPQRPPKTVATTSIGKTVTYGTPMTNGSIRIRTRTATTEQLNPTSKPLTGEGFDFGKYRSSFRMVGLRSGISPRFT